MNEDLVVRIKEIFNSVSAEEQKILKQILVELANTGESKTYNDIWLADYKEIPVSKRRFLTDPQYLGASNNNGQSIYPAWMEVMEELERTGNQYYEIVFTGATRTGKTSTAVSDCAYNLYKLMCLRNPQEYFSLKSVTTILVFFFNVTQTLAKGVAFREFNSTLSISPWFLAHGHMSKSEEYPTYIPEGGLIKVSYGSEAAHALGLATCVTGDTLVLTDNGLRAISELDGCISNLAQYTPDGDLIYCPSAVSKTKEVTDTIRIELEDGTVFEGTPDHKVLLSTGEYVRLDELTNSDDLITFNISEVIR